MSVPVTGREAFEQAYSKCRSILGPDTWRHVVQICGGGRSVKNLAPLLIQHGGDLDLPGFLLDLAHLEWRLNRLSTLKTKMPGAVKQISVNPTLELLKFSWKGLPSIIATDENSNYGRPVPGEEMVLLWREPKSGKIIAETASDEDLLALKLVLEEIAPEDAAKEACVHLGFINAAVDQASQKGILITPLSRIRRDPTTFPTGLKTDEKFLSSPVFTLQWHITQACDLHCKHCYDRSNIHSLQLTQGLRVLDDLLVFCRNRCVKGQVSFTGGNPLLYPHFDELYKAASERALAIAILANPTTRDRMEAFLEIDRPVFFQVSLEGLQGHNDEIRGDGHFDRVMDFLAILRRLDIYSIVMLTLTRENMDQVLPLAELLRDRTDLFTFNRLSMVGEGANLKSPSKDAYASFLETYVKAARDNPAMGLKDNLINIIKHQKGMNPFGGCTGYGCGAAFNFVSLLPDGTVQACRKFPSPMGNILRKSLGEIYDSEIARRYRSGCSGCGSCEIRPVCGGCLAVAYSHGMDIFRDRDPHCFLLQVES